MNFKKVQKITWIKFFLFYLFCVSTSEVVLSQSTHEVVNQVINESAFKEAELGIMVKNISTNTILVSYEANKMLTPASILKVLVASSVLNAFGPLHRFKTDVYITGEVDEGVLFGDVVIKGNGDPSLHSRLSGAITMQDILKDVDQELKRLNVSCINGSVIADASYFSLPGVPSGYMTEDVANYYGAGAYGINIQDNAFEIVLDRLKNKSVSVRSFDSLAVNFITSNVIASGYSDKAYAYYHPIENGLHVIGTVPTGVGLFKIKGAIRNPPLYAAKYFQHELSVAGYELQNDPSSLWRPYSTQGEVIFKKEYLSPTLKELLVPVLHKSNNVYSEVLYRHLLKTGSFTDGVEWSLLDGSGLSPGNRISATELVNALDMIRKSEYFNDFIETMPKNGLNGTVKSLLKSKKGSLYVKSGSMGGVRSYMGLRKTDNGEWIAFACMANELTSSSSSSRKAWEKLLNWVADL